MRDLTKNCQRQPTLPMCTALTICLCASVLYSVPVLTSHSLLCCRCQSVGCSGGTYAVKSADPVRARLRVWLSLADHTAPLCPLNVPIQSPVLPTRSIASPSFHFFPPHYAMKGDCQRVITYLDTQR